MTSSKRFKLVVQNFAYIALAKQCEDVCLIYIACKAISWNRGVYYKHSTHSQTFMVSVPGLSRSSESHKHELCAEAGHRTLRQPLQVGNNCHHTLVNDLLGRGAHHGTLN